MKIAHSLLAATALCAMTAGSVFAQQAEAPAVPLNTTASTQDGPLTGDLDGNTALIIAALVLFGGAAASGSSSGTD